MSTPECTHLREHAEELVLGELNGVERARGLRHASSCPACQAHLDSLALVTDRILLAAPELEPPAGFEGRVLDHLANAGAATRSPSPPSSVAAGSRLGRGRARLLAVAAAVILLAAGLAATSFGLGRSSAPSYHHQAGETRAVSSGSIVRQDGSVAGHAVLVDQPRPLVLVTVDSPRPSPYRVTCELVMADGRSQSVGTWGYDDVAQGAWAVGIPADLLSAVRMNVRDPGGAVLATANLA